ncbi:MAG: sigma-70 family RNA polymerase sigma factor [Planctomycetota bacterium]
MHDPDELFSHGVFLRRLAQALLLDEHAAADAVQETYLAALSRPATKGSPRAWLAAVVRNFARRQHRSVSRRNKRELAAARPEALPSTSEAAAQIELQEKVVAAVSALREPYRKTVVLRYYYDRTPTEIAHDEDVPVETVKTRLKRALGMLRVSMDRGYDRGTWSAILAPCLTPKNGVPWGVVLMTKKAILTAAVVLALASGGYLVHHVMVDDVAPRDDARARHVASESSLDGVIDPTVPGGSGAGGEKGRPSSDADAGAHEARAKRGDDAERANASPVRKEGEPTVRGTIRDRRGGIVRGAHVMLGIGKVQRVTFSSDEGSYRFFDEPGPSPRLGFATWPAQESSFTRNPRGVFEIVDYDESGRPRLQFRGIAGRIQSKDGQPLSKGFIAARRAADDTIVAHAPVVGEGWFALFGLKEGVYHLSYRESLSGWEVRALDGGSNIREWQTGVELKVIAGDTIEGLVVDPAGEPIPQIYLRAYLGKSKTGGYSGEDGRFRITKLKQGAVYRLMVFAKGYVPEVRDVPAGARDVRFRLDPGLEASGTLLDQNDKPKSVAQLIVRAEDGRDIRWYQPVATDGRFLLHGLPRGGITAHTVEGGNWWTWKFHAGDRDVVLRPEVAKFDPSMLGGPPR